MNSILVRFKNKSYYVDYDMLLNKAGDKLFAYEDPELEKVAKYRGGTLMFSKKDMEDELKNSIKMPIRMTSNLATEDNNMTKINEMRSIGKRNIDKLKKIMHYMWAKNYNVTEDEIIEVLPVKWWDTWESADSEIRRLVHDFLNKLRHARSIWDEYKLKGNKMTNEQKLRKYIREIIREALKEDAPYGEPDEALYLFKTGDDYLAGIQGESSIDEEGKPSAEELEKKKQAAEAKAKKQAYQRFFSQALAKFGYSGPASIPDEKKKSFFDYVDKNWTSKQEATKKVKSENLMTELWKGMLRQNYDDDYEQFVQYDEIYGISKRLGFNSSEEAWEANPKIQVGVNPKDLKVIGKVKEKYIEPGKYVLVEPTAVGLKNSYPAANWLKNRMKVKLVDGAPNAGTLDVIDVELPDGRQESIYDFNIVKKLNTNN